MEQIKDAKLSAENYALLNENYLYEKKPIIDNSFSVGTVPGTYHCRNWTFRCYKREGKAYMVDTYRNSFQYNTYEVTDNNIKEFNKVFDFREVAKISNASRDEYEESDKFYVATDSGGYSCGGLTWVKKNALKSQKLLIKKTKAEIESLENKLRWKKEDLEKYENGSHCDLKDLTPLNQ
jgi:hypothetical protein